MRTPESRPRPTRPMPPTRSVLPDQPGDSDAHDGGRPDVIVGNPITDNATLTGTAMQPGTDGLGQAGTINATAGSPGAGQPISWTVQGPGNCSASGLTVSGSPKTVSGDGTYARSARHRRFSARARSSRRTAAAVRTWCCRLLPGCSRSHGHRQRCITTSQDWLPNDTATLTGPTNLTGTLTFQLYTGDNCGVTSGAPVANQVHRPRQQRCFGIDVQHLEHHVQGEGIRVLLVARHPQRQHVG